MLADYKPFVDRMIQRYEGPYGWDKRDPGGPTKYGITCFDLAEHRHQQMTSMATWAPIVQAMPLQEAEDIYATKYANGIRFNDLPAGPDVVMMDYGVNSGVSRPIVVARALLGLKPGKMDDELMAAIHKADAEDFSKKMCAERLRFMHAIRGGQAWQEFGHGWGARVADLQNYADHLVLAPTVAPPEAPDLSQVVTPKAQHVPNTAGTQTTGGAVAAGATAWATYGWKVGLLVAGAAIAGGIAYEVWQEHKASVANNLVHA